MKRFCLTISKDVYPEYNRLARRLCAMNPIRRALAFKMRRQLREMAPEAWRRLEGRA